MLSAQDVAVGRFNRTGRRLCHTYEYPNLGIVAHMSSSDRLRKRLTALIEAAGFNRSQAAHAIGCTPSRLGDYLAGRTTPSAMVLLDLEDAAEQAANRSWMRASDVIDAVVTPRVSQFRGCERSWGL